jgi:hypothetical protein
MPLRTTLPIALALCFAAIPAQAGTPVLFRSGIACDLSIDGESAGSIAANGFRRVVLSTGEHIVECKGSFYVQTPNSGAPFLVSTTIKVEGTDQKVVVLPQAVLHLQDTRECGDDSLHCRGRTLEAWGNAASADMGQ